MSPRKRNVQAAIEAGNEKIKELGERVKAGDPVAKKLLLDLLGELLPNEDGPDSPEGPTR